MNKIPNKYRLVFVCLVLASATIAVFWQLHQHEFISFDDDLYIIDNGHVKAGLTWKSFIWAFTKTHAYNWHPLTWLSHMLDCWLYGLNPGSHHFTNALLHTANAILLLLVLNQMTGCFWQSAFIAALFALHPLHVESVAWVSERKDTLSTLFWLLTMAAYLRYVKQPKTGWYLLTLLVFTLGLLTKQMLVTLPFVLLLLDYWPLGRLAFNKQTPPDPTQSAGSVSLRLCILEKIPFLALSAAASTIIYIVQRRTGVMRLLIEYPLPYRIANALVSYSVYIKKMLWPQHLAIFYPHPDASLPLWKITFSVSLLVLITIAVIRKTKKCPYLIVGWLWYLGTLVPVIGLVQVGNQALADRYTYITLTGLFIIIAWGVPDLLAHFKYKKAILWPSAILLLLILAVITWFQLGHWHNNTTLYSHAAKVVGNNWWAHNNFGIALSKQNKLDDAVNHFQKAIKIKPNYARAHNNLGNTLKLMGNIDEAVSHYSRAVQINPYHISAHNNLAIIFTEQGKLDDALIHFQYALQLEPDQPMFLNGIARILATHPDPKKRDADKAIALAERAAKLTNHHNPIILSTLAAGYAAAGRFDQAVSTAQTALDMAADAENNKLADYIREQLKLYRKAKP